MAGKSRFYLKGRVQVYSRRGKGALMRLWQVGLSHACKDGGPVLRFDKSLRNVNGIFVHTPRYSLWFLFRRFSFYEEWW